MPLATCIDHVFMNISYFADDVVIEVIQRLATFHGLILYDPQDDTRPPAANLNQASHDPGAVRAGVSTSRC